MTIQERAARLRLRIDSLNTIHDDETRAAIGELCRAALEAVERETALREAEIAGIGGSYNRRFTGAEIVAAIRAEFGIAEKEQRA